MFMSQICSRILYHRYFIFFSSIFVYYRLFNYAIYIILNLVVIYHILSKISFIDASCYLINKINDCNLPRMLITFKLGVFTEVDLTLMSCICHIYNTYIVYYTYIIDLYALYCSDNVL
jgi:hypothetical protein